MALHEILLTEVENTDSLLELHTARFHGKGITSTHSDAAQCFINLRLISLVIVQLDSKI